MARLRPLLFATVGLIMVAATAVTVIETRGGDGGHKPLAPGPEGERQPIQRFIDSGRDPCSLPFGELLARYLAPYPDLPTLINDSALIILGRPVALTVGGGTASSAGGRILTTVQVDEVLAGPAPGASIVLDSAQGLIQSGTELIRVAEFGIDSCIQPAGSWLLFLQHSSDPAVFRIDPQGGVRIDGDTIQAARFTDLFNRYGTRQQLLDAVRQIVREQQALGLPKGVLICRHTWAPLSVCPGDTFNPYLAFALSSASYVEVTTTDPGPGQGTVATARLDPSPALRSLLQSLDDNAAVDSLTVPPDDLIGLTILPAGPVGSRNAFLLQYSPSTGIIQMPPTGGQFPAPPAFLAAMQPFLAHP